MKKGINELKKKEKQISSKNKRHYPVINHNDWDWRLSYRKDEYISYIGEKYTSNSKEYIKRARIRYNNLTNYCVVEVRIRGIRGIVGKSSGHCNMIAQSGAYIKKAEKDLRKKIRERYGLFNSFVSPLADNQYKLYFAIILILTIIAAIITI